MASNAIFFYECLISCVNPLTKESSMSLAGKITLTLEFRVRLNLLNACVKNVECYKL